MLRITNNPIRDVGAYNAANAQKKVMVEVFNMMPMMVRVRQGEGMFAMEPRGSLLIQCDSTFKSRIVNHYLKENYYHIKLYIVNNVPVPSRIKVLDLGGEEFMSLMHQLLLTDMDEFYEERPRLDQLETGTPLLGSKDNFGSVSAA